MFIHIERLLDQGLNIYFLNLFELNFFRNK